MGQRQEKSGFVIGGSRNQRSITKRAPLISKPWSSSLNYARRKKTALSLLTLCAIISSSMVAFAGSTPSDGEAIQTSHDKNERSIPADHKRAKTGSNTGNSYSSEFKPGGSANELTQSLSVNGRDIKVPANGSKELTITEDGQKTSVKIHSESSSKNIDADDSGFRVRTEVNSSSETHIKMEVNQ